VPERLREWLQAQYARFARESARGVQLVDDDATEASQQAIPRLRGFGRELYRNFAPVVFKRALWELQDMLGDGFRSIHVFSEDPTIPWELMLPVREDGSEEMDFLGSRFRLARWHFAPSEAQLDRPPQSMRIQEIVVIAPSYQGAQELRYQETEIQALQGIPGYRPVPGVMASVRDLFGRFPQGIIHFAGHGFVEPIGEGIVEYSIRLEDTNLDLMMWKGLTSSRSAAHPIVFLNACDVGQANRVANFVDGWAPSVLEAGASGYIGSLWPLSDKGAAEFAALFYKNLREDAVARGHAIVADALLKTRRQFYQNGDPTYLAYVYYGDPLLRVSWED
jgi:CHAT domain-containing protein